ncbi:MAG: DUF1565 domain-containing protein [Chitinivibrionales bacterium]|nr:DUF1565 domain-containing protein [Chitinivibrionales bacterium]
MQPVRFFAFKHLLLIPALLCLFIYLTPFVVTGKSLTVPSSKYKTISLAMIKAAPGDTIWVEKGTYNGQVGMGNGVTLISRPLFGAVLDGNGRETVITLNGKGAVHGFEITNGTIGVFSKGEGNIISRNRIIENWGAGIVCVGHLPKIEDNVIAYNAGSGVQGWKLRVTVFPAINHNTIAYNSNHGIAIGGSSEFDITNNIIAFNEKFGLKVSQDDPRIRMKDNSFYGNSSAWAVLPEGNYRCNPIFADPQKYNFKLGTDSRCKAMSPEGHDLGVRFEN